MGLQNPGGAPAVRTSHGFLFLEWGQPIGVNDCIFIRMTTTGREGPLAEFTQQGDLTVETLKAAVDQAFREYPEITAFGNSVKGELKTAIDKSI